MVLSSNICHNELTVKLYSLHALGKQRIQKYLRYVLIKEAVIRHVLRKEHLGPAN